MISKSLLFLTIARNTLCEAINQSSITKKKSAKLWLTNEATDYEIMSLLTTGKIPTESNNIIAEHMIWENFKHFIFKNRKALSEVLGSGMIKEFLIEQGPVTAYGLSSAKPIMEAYLSEAPPSFMDDVVKKTGSDAWKMGKTAHDYWTKGAGKDLIQKGAGKVVGKVADRGKAVGQAITGKGAENLAKSQQTAQNLTKNLGSTRGQLSASQGALKATQGKLADTTTNLGNTTKQLGDTTKQLGQTKGELTTATSQTGYRLWAGAKQGLEDFAGKTGASNVAGKINARFGTNISGAKAGLAAGVGALAVAALLTYGAYKTYQRFFSKAAQACKGQSGAQRDMCVAKFKQNAIKAQMQDLAGGMKACKSTKNPAQCQAAIQAKIQKLKVKLAKAGA